MAPQEDGLHLGPRHAAIAKAITSAPLKPERPKEPGLQAKKVPSKGVKAPLAAKGEGKQRKHGPTTPRSGWRGVNGKVPGNAEEEPGDPLGAVAGDLSEVNCVCTVPRLASSTQATPAGGSADGPHWNVGVVPQTWVPQGGWEEGKVASGSSASRGEGTLLEVLEVGARLAHEGEVYPVKLLGAFLVSRGEGGSSSRNYVIVAVRCEDARAAAVDAVGDLESLVPGIVAAMKASVEARAGRDAEGAGASREMTPGPSWSATEVTDVGDARAKSIVKAAHFSWIFTRPSSSATAAACATKFWATATAPGRNTPEATAASSKDTRLLASSSVRSTPSLLTGSSPSSSARTSASMMATSLSSPERGSPASRREHATSSRGPPTGEAEKEGLKEEARNRVATPIGFSDIFEGDTSPESTWLMKPGPKASNPASIIGVAEVSDSVAQPSLRLPEEASVLSPRSASISRATGSGNPTTAAHHRRRLSLPVDPGHYPGGTTTPTPPGQQSFKGVPGACSSLGTPPRHHVPATLSRGEESDSSPVLANRPGWTSQLAQNGRLDRGPSGLSLERHAERTQGDLVKAELGRPTASTNHRSPMRSGSVEPPSHLQQWHQAMACGPGQPGLPVGANPYQAGRAVGGADHRRRHSAECAVAWGEIDEKLCNEGVPGPKCRSAKLVEDLGKFKARLAASLQLAEQTEEEEEGEGEGSDEGFPTREGPMSCRSFQGQGMPAAFGDSSVGSQYVDALVTPRKGPLEGRRLWGRSTSVTSAGLPVCFPRGHGFAMRGAGLHGLHPEEGMGQSWQWGGLGVVSWQGGGPEIVQQDDGLRGSWLPRSSTTGGTRATSGAGARAGDGLVSQGHQQRRTSLACREFPTARDASSQAAAAGGERPGLRQFGRSLSVVQRSHLERAWPGVGASQPVWQRDAAESAAGERRERGRAQDCGRRERKERGSSVSPGASSGLSPFQAWESGTWRGRGTSRSPSVRSGDAGALTHDRDSPPPTPGNHIAGDAEASPGAGDGSIPKRNFQGATQHPPGSTTQRLFSVADAYFVPLKSVEEDAEPGGRRPRTHAPKSPVGALSTLQHWKAEYPKSPGGVGPWTHQPGTRSSVSRRPKADTGGLTAVPRVCPERTTCQDLERSDSEMDDEESPRLLAPESAATAMQPSFESTQNSALRKAPLAEVQPGKGSSDSQREMSPGLQDMRRCKSVPRTPLGYLVLDMDAGGPEASDRAAMAESKTPTAATAAEGDSCAQARGVGRSLSAPRVRRNVSFDANVYVRGLCSQKSTSHEEWLEDIKSGETSESDCERGQQQAAGQRSVARGTMVPQF